MKYFKNNILFKMFFISLLFIMTMIFSHVRIFSSTIEYYDIVVEQGYELTYSNINDIGLNVVGKDINFEMIDINKVDDSSYLLTYSDTEYTFSINVSVTEGIGSFNVIQTQRHSLTIKDDSVVLNSGNNIATCTVINSYIEEVDVSVYTTSNSVGIYTGSIACDTNDIVAESKVSVLNIGEETKFAIHNDLAIYALDLHLTEDELLSELSNEDILNRVEADTNSSRLYVEEVTDSYVTISNGVSDLQLDVINDSAPVINSKKYYELESEDEFDILSLVDINDDYTEVDNLNIEYDRSLTGGINIKTLKVTDEYGNETSKDILVLVNDGSYVIGNNKYYILPKSDIEIISGSELSNLEVFSIDSLEYVTLDFDSNILGEISTEHYLNDVDNQHIESSETDENNNIYIVLMFLSFLLISILILILI